tara:strand:+ start:153 stop:1454 length:1302 start_codon:yes stop_codon:yes gene_type:complete
MQKIKKVLLINLSLGNFLFYLGIIFLPSAVPIGGGLLLIAIIISISKTKFLIFKDKWNYPLLISAGLIISSCIKNSIAPSLSYLSEWKISYIWLYTLNWIPLFLCFWGFQEFLKTKHQRKLFAYSLIIGTIPVIVSCIAQNWFNLYGPFETLNGLIVWFQKPPQPTKVISGLFSNPNYAGFWLSSIFPFSLALFLRQMELNIKSFLALIVSIMIFYLAILTNSRNTLIALISSFPFLISAKLLFITLFLLAIAVLILTYLKPSTILGFGIQFKLIPTSLIGKIFSNEFGSISNFPRMEIFSQTIKLICKKPFLGWGGSTFALIYMANQEITIKAQHSHNLFLQIAYDFGLPLSIILTLTIFTLFIKASKKIIAMKKTSEFYIDKAFLASSFIGISFHLFDIPYYDVRVSILIWTLFAGLKSILDENNNKTLKN